MTQAEFYETVRTFMGGSLISVEIEDADLAVCFKSAIRTMKRYGRQMQRHAFIAIPVTTDTVTYDLPSNVSELVSVLPPRSILTSYEDPAAIRLLDELFAPMNSMHQLDFLTFELNSQRIEMIDRYFSRAVDFQYDRHKQQVTFMGRPRMDDTYYLEAYLDLTDEEYYEEDFVIRWTVAEAKIILGTAYRKFPSLPTPQGETSLSGAELIQDGKDEKAQLIEDINNNVDGNVDFMPVYIV